MTDLVKLLLDEFLSSFLNVLLFLAFGTLRGLHGSECVLEAFRVLSRRQLVRVILHPVTDQALCLLLLVVGEDTLSILLQIGRLRVRHDGLKYLAAALRADEERERDMLIAVDRHFSTGQIFKKEINGRGTIIFGTFVRFTTSFDDVEKFRKLDFSVIIDGGHDILNLLPIINEA